MHRCRCRCRFFFCGVVAAHLELLAWPSLTAAPWAISGSHSSLYVRSEDASYDMPLDADVFQVPHGFNAPQQVPITQGDYYGKAVIVSWITPYEVESSNVFYGTDNENYSFTAMAELTTTYTAYNYTSGFIHHCTLDDLEYNTTYYYKLGEGNATREFSFTTPPECGPDIPYTFGLIGDLGQTADSNATVEHYLQSKGQTLLLGELDEFKSYIHRLRTPHTASQSTSPLWYAIQRGPAYIISLSSYSSFVKYSPQYQWLEAELLKIDRTKTPWLVIMMHVPLYSSNSHHYLEGEGMRSVFESWFVEYKVDVVFAGHVHAYERSYPVSNILFNLTNDACQPIFDEDAPVYIVIGDGGNVEAWLYRTWSRSQNILRFEKLALVMGYLI
ncbi:hypothetical protein L7F22_022174 [Adiantum nelumboides]|nr:hypothetical protein [Adiantum nelumboides]